MSCSGEDLRCHTFDLLFNKAVPLVENQISQGVTKMQMKPISLRAEEERDQSIVVVKNFTHWILRITSKAVSRRSRKIEETHQQVKLRILQRAVASARQIQHQCPPHAV